MQAEKYLPFQDLWTEVCMFASQLLNHQMRQQFVESFSSSRVESDNVACKKKIHLTLCSLTFITSIISHTDDPFSTVPCLQLLSCGDSFIT